VKDFSGSWESRGFSTMIVASNKVSWCACFPAFYFFIFFSPFSVHTLAAAVQRTASEITERRPVWLFSLALRSPCL
jgi:hypothetical protein